MRTQGFGMMAELVRDMIYQKNDLPEKWIENFFTKRPKTPKQNTRGNANQKIMSSSIPAEQRVFCSTGYL
jgi:hypothetical protein